MTLQHFFDLFAQYGLIVIAAVCFAEHMNLPGFPAGIIMPALGILIHQSALSLPVAVVLSVAGSVGGSVALYLLCFYGGVPAMHKLFGKSEKFHRFVLRCESKISHRRAWGLLVCRLIPVLRTIVSIPAGLLRIPLREFALWSAAGITIWNTAFIAFGYFGANLLLTTF